MFANHPRATAPLNNQRYDLEMGIQSHSDKDFHSDDLGTSRFSDFSIGDQYVHRDAADAHELHATGNPVENNPSAVAAESFLEISEELDSPSLSTGALTMHSKSCTTDNAELSHWSFADDEIADITREVRLRLAYESAFATADRYTDLPSASDLVSTPLYRRHHLARPDYPPRTIEFHYLWPLEPKHTPEETILELEAFEAWKRRDQAVTAAVASRPDITPVPAIPVFVGLARQQKVFELTVAPHYQVQVGERLECFGLMTGVWKVTGQMVRTHEMTFFSKDPPTETVYVMCTNSETEQRTWLKLSAHYFYPTTRAIRARRHVQKLGALFARSPPLFLSRPSEPVRGFAGWFRRFFGCCIRK